MTVTVRASTLVISAALMMTLTAGSATAHPYGGMPHHRDITERVNVSSREQQANTEDENPATAIDRTGRYLAFSSAATNLVAGDTNGVMDVFVRDRKQGRTTRVSVSSGGSQGRAESGFSVAISAKGRFVAFLSNAGNLAGRPNQGPDRTNVFLHDRSRHTTEQVNVATNGQPADHSASWPVAVSATGRYVAFVSAASNLAAGKSNREQVYVRDRQRRTTARVSLTNAGKPFPNGVSLFDASISADGRFVAFADADSVFVRDRRRAKTVRIAEGRQPQLSASGRFVAFQSCAADVVPGDSNDQCDVFLRDRWRGTTRMVSVSSGGHQSNGGSYVPYISPEGRYVSFSSDSSNLVFGDTNAARDVFVRDTRRPRTVRVSVGYRGQARVGDPDGPRSFGGSLSTHGRYVTYSSHASNLVPGDTNRVTDVFVTRVR